MATELTHESVLEARRGGRKCPAAVSDLLLTNRDKWEVEDVVTSFQDGKGSSAAKDDILALWDLVFNDCDGHENLTIADKQRYKMWIFSAADEADEDGSMVDVSKDGATTTVKEAAKASIKSAGGKEADDGMHGAFMNDMKEQGMSSPRQLAYVSASLFLGKHASRKECAGLNAGETAGISDVIRKAAKMPGAKTLTDTLKDSVESRSRLPLDTFINRLTDSLSNAGDDHACYAAQASSKIRSFYNRVCEVVDDELAVPLYFEDLVQFSHVGRGIPKQVDLELVRIAEKRAYGMRNPKQKAKAREDPDQSSMMSQMEEMLSALGKFEGLEQRLGSKLNTSISRIDTRLDAMERKVKTVADASAAEVERRRKADQFIECTKCGQKGHRASECPNGDKKKAP